MQNGMPAVWLKMDIMETCVAAFLKNTRWFKSLLFRRLTGWDQKAIDKVSELRDSADGFVQNLNDQYTNPSGKS